MKNERLYRIRHKITGQFYSGYIWIGKRKNSVAQFPVASFRTDPYDMCLRNLTIMVEDAIRRNIQSIFDECEIEAIEISYIPVETSVTMKKVKEREEAKAIMNILKN